MDLEDSLNNTFRLDKSVASTRRVFDPTGPSQIANLDPDLLEPPNFTNYVLVRRTSPTTVADKVLVKRQSSVAPSLDFSTLDHERVFPPMIPKTADTYNATYKRLDRMEQRLKIE